jgi:transcriptional regulator with XRE-family HTH domain
VQFRTNNNLCRKCKLSLDTVEEPPVPEMLPPTAENGHVSHSPLQIAAAIRMMRQRSGLSQRQLAMRMQVPRTYVSKIENDKATPTLSSLQRLANALEVSVPDLLIASCENSTRDAEIEQLMADEFIREIVPFVAKLDAMQRSTVLAQMRELTVRPRRMT